MNLKLAVGVVLFSLFPARPADPPVPPSTRPEIVAHLSRTMVWHRHVAAAEQSAQPAADPVARESAQRAATRAPQLAFDFGRGAAPLVAPERGAGAPATTSMARAAERATERVAHAEAQLAEIDAALAKGGGSRTVLAARRSEVLAELNFAKQIRDSVQGIRALAPGGADLLSFVDRFERSVPELLRGAPEQPASAPKEEAPRIESSGILALVTEAIAMSRARGDYDDVLAETETIRKSYDQLRAPLVADLTAAIRRGEAAVADSASQTPEQIDQDRFDIERMAARYKQVSAALAPLREHGLQLDLARAGLTKQRETAQQRYAAAARTLLFRAGGLIVTVLLILGISVLWRRLVFRYVRDVRRRKQFLLVRRVVVSGVIVVVIALGLVNEVGSLATYAGFLTAGLAVALQNPIASVVAYFFLIGRYGLKVGDRVTISGVTGEIVEIGLVRLYLMEMTGDGADVHPTGRVVGYSNSVIFQPSALFRQMPGADYVWHAATLTFVPETDAQTAETRLMAAVNGVYEDYRERVEQQHASFQRLVDVPIAGPKPTSRVATPARVWRSWSATPPRCARHPPPTTGFSPRWPRRSRKTRGSP